MTPRSFVLPVITGREGGGDEEGGEDEGDQEGGEMRSQIESI